VKKRRKQYGQILLGQEGHGRRKQEYQHIVFEKAGLFF
jgi:hypothetical protein